MPLRAVSGASHRELKCRSPRVSLDTDCVGRRDRERRIVVQDCPRRGLRPQRRAVGRVRQGYGEALIIFDLSVAAHVDGDRFGGSFAAKFNVPVGKEPPKSAVLAGFAPLPVTAKLTDAAPDSVSRSIHRERERCVARLSSTRLAFRAEIENEASSFKIVPLAVAVPKTARSKDLRA